MKASERKMETGARKPHPSRVLLTVSPVAVLALSLLGRPAAGPELSVTRSETEATTTVFALMHNAVPVPSEQFEEEVLWLARCIYSETKREHEQELVGWVVRNRVETRYRGRESYRSTVLDPFQFSAFNPNSSSREHLFRLDRTTPGRSWRQALRVAREVMLADASQRPFPVKTRHFYSERSLGDQEDPDWIEGREPVDARSLAIDLRRFRFYSGVR